MCVNHLHLHYQSSPPYLLANIPRITRTTPSLTHALTDWLNCPVLQNASSSNEALQSWVKLKNSISFLLTNPHQHQRRPNLHRFHLIWASPLEYTLHAINISSHRAVHQPHQSVWDSAGRWSKWKPLYWSRQQQQQRTINAFKLNNKRCGLAPPKYDNFTHFNR